jgi:hypothetical protein
MPTLDNRSTVNGEDVALMKDTAIWDSMHDYFIRGCAYNCREPVIPKEIREGIASL